MIQTAFALREGRFIWVRRRPAWRTPAGSCGAD
jgi:hypothetical protein